MSYFLLIEDAMETRIRREIIQGYLVHDRMPMYPLEIGFHLELPKTVVALYGMTQNNWSCSHISRVLAITV